MSHTTTVFATSFLVAVAAGWSLLDASPETEGPDARPALHELVVDGAKLSIGLDKERVPAGQKVHVTLAMVDGGTPRGVDLEVTLLEQQGDMMSRSMPPPREVARKSVHVGAEPVVLPLELAGATRGRRAQDPILSAGSATQYTIVVAPAKAGEDDADAMAYVPAFAYQPEAFALTVDPPAPAEVGAPTEVVVRVKNVSGKPLKGISLGLSTALVTTNEAPRIDTLAPGAETVVRIKGTRVAAPDGAAPIIQVFGYAEYGGTAAAWAEVDPATGKLARRASAPYAAAVLGLF
jgi:hypothetical protein